MIQAEIQISEIAGTRVSFTKAPGKPLLLLIRMASRGMGIWDGVWDRLCVRFSVANFDLKLPSTVELETPRLVFTHYAKTAFDVAEHLGYKTYHVLGWNGGIHVALRAAADYPDNVRSCVLLNPFRRLEDMRAVDKGLDIMQAMMEQPDRLLYAYYWLMMGLSDRFIHENFDVVDQMAEQRVGGDRFVTSDSLRMMKWARSLRQDWVSDEELARITLPVLLVATGLNKWGAGPTPAMARLLAEKIQGSVLRDIPEHGPLSLIEDPEKFLGLIGGFYDSLQIGVCEAEEDEE